MTRAPDVVIVGAGITGAAAALSLAEAGASVEVVDRWFPAAMASGWTLAGVRQSGRDPAELPLARAAVARWTALDDELDGDTGYVQQGNLRLARNEAEVGTIRTLVETQTAAGLDLSFLDGPDAVRAIAPALAPSIHAASFCPTDGHADPVSTVRAFLTAAERRGVRVSSGTAVEGLLVDKGRIIGLRTDQGDIKAGAVLLATGIETNALMAPLGFNIPFRTPLVTVLQTAPLDPVVAPVLGVANADMALRQERNGRIRATSGAIDWAGAVAAEGGRPVARPTMARVAATVETIAAVMPSFADAEIAAFWGGVLDLTPDALPVIDHVPGIDNLVVAAGFSGHGFGIGPVTGPLAADLVLGRQSPHDLTPFRADRFAAANGGPKAKLSLHG